MKNAFLFSSLILLLILSCDKEEIVIAELSHIPENKYYETDILNAIPIYGKWEVIRTSGGFSGAGYLQDFDFLLMKPNGIFGILRNDSLLTTGKVIIKASSSSDSLIQLIPDDTINLIIFDESFVSFNSDTLNLVAPCCDRFNTHFKKVP